MQESKKTWDLSILGVVALLVAVVGATYAFYNVQGDTVATGGKRVTASTTDSLAFEKGNDISLNLNQNNFSNTKGSSSMESFVKAILTANNKTNTATNNYYIYIDITENEIGYTTPEKTPELVLTVTDKDNNPVTIAGLDPVNMTDRTGEPITGYDITGVKDLITILDNKEIAVDTTNTEHTTIDIYNIKITMVNLDKDQTANTGKNFVSKIMIQKEKLINTFADYITSLYTLDGENGLYYHDGEGTYGEYEAGDDTTPENSIRYTGKNPDNYVCFGSDEETCPEDNLYRIIGVFGDKVKLIKETSIGNMAWNSITDNTWSTSSLKSYLNGTYLDGIGIKWSKMIAEATWKVGGNTYENIMDEVNAKNAYKNEITNPATDGTDGLTEDTFKVGLMYVSDYRYAADPTKENAWSALSAHDYDYVNANNWMYMSNNAVEWTISRYSSIMSHAFFVNEAGTVNDGTITNSRGVRPSIYLTSEVEYLRGDGQSTSPFRIK